MRTTLLTAAAAVLCLSASPVLAADKAEELAKELKCMKCHAITSKKKAPALKTSAAQWKAAGLSADKAVAAMKEKHEGDIEGSDEQLKTLATWILSL